MWILKFPHCFLFLLSFSFFPVFSFLSSFSSSPVRDLPLLFSFLLRSVPLFFFHSLLQQIESLRELELGIMVTPAVVLACNRSSEAIWVWVFHSWRDRLDRSGSAAAASSDKVENWCRHLSFGLAVLKLTAAATRLAGAGIEAKTAMNGASASWALVFLWTIDQRERKWINARSMGVKRGSVKLDSAGMSFGLCQLTAALLSSFVEGGTKK